MTEIFDVIYIFISECGHICFLHNLIESSSLRLVPEMFYKQCSCCNTSSISDIVLFRICDYYCFLLLILVYNDILFLFKYEVVKWDTNLLL